MVFFRMWLRRKWRMYAKKPIPGARAQKLFDRVTMAYFLIAWTTLGIFLYRFNNEDYDAKKKKLAMVDDPTNVHYFGRVLGIDRANVIRWDSKTKEFEKFEFNYEDYMKEYEEKLAIAEAEARRIQREEKEKEKAKEKEKEKEKLEKQTSHDSELLADAL